jgi:hypothetical protein
MISWKIVKKESSSDSSIVGIVMVALLVSVAGIVGVSPELATPPIELQSINNLSSTNTVLQIPSCLLTWLPGLP